MSLITAMPEVLMLWSTTLSTLGSGQVYFHFFPEIKQHKEMVVDVSESTKASASMTLKLLKISCLGQSSSQLVSPHRQMSAKSATADHADPPYNHVR